MDLQTLTQLFSTTYNPDPNVRKAAELQIRKVSPSNYFITSIRTASFVAELVLVMKHLKILSGFHDN